MSEEKRNSNSYHIYINKDGEIDASAAPIDLQKACELAKQMKEHSLQECVFYWNGEYYSPRQMNIFRKYFNVFLSKIKTRRKNKRE